MSGGMTFRRKCEHCGDIFFSPARDAPACPKCVRRYGLKPPKPAPVPRAPDRRPPPTAAPAPPRAPLTPRPSPAAPPAVREPVPAPAGDRSVAPAAPHPPAPRPSAAPPRPAAPAPKKPSAPPRLPRARELTEEHRAAILAAAQALPTPEGEPLRAVHARIAAALNVTRKMVADVLQGCVDRQELTDEIRKAVAERYRAFVMRMERPPQGRHRLLTQEFRLTREQVNEALQSILQELPSPRDLERPLLFRIEQAYWRHLEARDVPLDEIPTAIAAQLSLPVWPVARFLDSIHDDAAKLRSTPLPDAETQRRILDGYASYLASDGPPDECLHPALAAETGATTRQVHRVLLEHRWAVRGERRG